MDLAIQAFSKEPQIFLPVSLLSALLLGAGLFLIFRTVAILVRRTRSLDWIAGSVAGLDRCRIANWTEVRNLVPRLEEPGLNQDLDRIETDSEDMYHGVWIPKPHAYLKMRDVLPVRELWLFSREALVLPPAVGIAFTAIAFLIAYSLGGSLVPDHPYELAVACAVPTAIGFLVLLGHSILFGALGARVKASLAGLARQIERHVPVFSEASSMVTLIDSFLAYDRQMAAAVTFLDQHVDDLASGQLAKAVSQASEKVMRTAVAPAIASLSEATTEALAKIDRNQREGMQLLAKSFAAALGDDFRGHFEPVAKRMDDATTLLTAAGQEFAKTLELLKAQREEVAAMAAEMARAQKALQDERAGFLTEISSVSANLNTLTAAADRMAQIYEGAGSSLSGSIDGMSAAMNALGERVESTIGQAAEESKKTGEQAAAALAANQEHLDEMRRQIQVLSDELANRIDQIVVGFGSVTGETLTGFKETMDVQNETFSSNIKTLLTTMEEESRSMSLYAKEIDVDLTELNATFKGSVAGFNEEVLAEIRKALGAFDDGLAEIVRRLSVSASEIGDAVEALPQALRGIAPR